MRKNSKVKVKKKAKKKSVKRAKGGLPPNYAQMLDNIIGLVRKQIKGEIR